MPRPIGLGPDYWFKTTAVWTASGLLWGMILLPNMAESKTVKVCAGNSCTTITLPKAGKCVWRTIKGYRVRICR